MAGLDYREELSDAEPDDEVPFDDEVDQVAMREGKAKVITALGEIADLIPPSEIEQALWDNYYDVDKSVAVLSENYEQEIHKLGDATVEVLARLGESSEKVTPKQIKDALWHYYFDIDKTVAYLDRTYINPPEKPKPKAKATPAECKYISNYLYLSHHNRTEASRRDKERRVSGGGRDGMEPKNDPVRTYDLAPRMHVPAEWHFYGVKWTNGLCGPQTTFIEPPRYGGLLGGSGKPSKLQALAAARKNKRAAENSQPGHTGPGKSTAPTSSTPASSTTNKENIKLDIRLLSKRRRDGSKVDLEATPPASGLLGQGNPGALRPSPSKDGDCAPGENLAAENQVYTLHRAAQPSAFASTLFGTSSNATAHQAEAYPFPYTASPSYSAKPFLEPSPDDIVLAAQAKGSRFSGKK